MDIQQLFHLNLPRHLDEARPNGYVYPPITLGILKLVGFFPTSFSGPGYWMLIATSVLAVLWVGMQLVENGERRLFSFVAVAAPFFPGFLQNDTLLSGNIAFPLYGAVFLTAVRGWKREKWLWCYIAIVVASCVKLPMLTLLALPVLSARRQWLNATIAGGGAVALFVIQAIVSPVLFRHYLQAVNMQLEYNLDFGASPAGILSKLLMQSGFRYQLVALLFYIAYATASFTCLLVLSRRYLDGRIEFRQWMPVMLVGTLLLNPRIMEYDFILLTIPMTLIVRRAPARWMGKASGAIGTGTALLGANLIAVSEISRWKPTAGVLLVAVFCVGCFSLWNHSEHLEAQAT